MHAGKAAMPSAMEAAAVKRAGVKSTAVKSTAVKSTAMEPATTVKPSASAPMRRSSNARLAEHSSSY
jgi:hypothetical protein